MDEYNDSLNEAFKSKDSTATAVLGYKPPYKWERIINFLALRAIPGVEKVSDGKYNRTVRISDNSGKTIYGLISVSDRPEKSTLIVTLSDSLLLVLPKVLGCIQNLFDLHCDPYVVNERLAASNNQIPGNFTCGIRVPGCFDSFELCVRAILGQQITVKAASTLAGKMAKSFGNSMETEIDGLFCVFPSAEDVLNLDGKIEDHLCPLGIISARAKAIQTLAQMINDKAIDFESGNDPKVEMKKLMSIPGVGVWTATYIAMRALGWKDAFPETDLGIRKALGDKKPKEIRAMSEQWKPWRSYAAMALWDSLHAGVK